MAPRRRKPNGQESHEKKYWQQQARDFKRKFPAAARESRAVERIAREISPKHKAWLQAKRIAAGSWLEVENYLFSGKAMMAVFSTKLQSAQNASRQEKRNAADFFTARARITRRVLKKTDWTAKDKASDSKDALKEIDAEITLFGRLKDAAKRGVLQDFAHLVYRLGAAKDKGYLRCRQRVTLAKQGLENREKAHEEKMEELKKKFAAGRITGRLLARTVTIEEIMVAHQHYEIFAAEEALYRHMMHYSKEAGLTLFLGSLAEESARAKAKFLEDMRKGERTMREHDW